MITYDCGCVNETDPPSGILRNVFKCNFHRSYARDPASLGETYYRELANLDGSGELVNSTHLAELIEALGPFPAAVGNCRALEIGCGLSPYVCAIQVAGWQYAAIDCSPWVSIWMRDHWGVTTMTGSWEAWNTTAVYGLILCAHALEHMVDAPSALAKMAGSLETGGELWIVVPDDSDPTNPDHLWFFDEHTLRSAVASTGLTILRLEVRSIVPREKFMFVRARKP